MNKILVISGPTASGKSHLADKLLERSKNALVLNADSMQVYKDLPILSAQPPSVISLLPSSRRRPGPSTAKIPPKGRQFINEDHSVGSLVVLGPGIRRDDGVIGSDDDIEIQRYKLYSFLNFYENCSAGIWLKEADKLIKEAFKLGMQPVIVGGTGLYLKALLDGIIEIPDIPNNVKERVQDQFATLGKEKFYELLSSLDPISAAKIHKNDSYRMQRAMEVYSQTGQSITSFQTLGPNYDAVHISVDPARETLYRNCDLRFQTMLKDGAEQETEGLFNKIKARPGKYNIENTLGYRSLVSHIIGQLSLENAILEANQATRNYAKRQCTWFKNQFKDKISLQYAETITEIETKFLEIVTREFKLLI
jgi:tRNA dimethylallyltransferase